MGTAEEGFPAFFFKFPEIFPAVRQNLSYPRGIIFMRRLRRSFSVISFAAVSNQEML